MRRVGQAKGVQNGVFQEGEWQAQGPKAERQFQKLRKDERGAAGGDKVEMTWILGYHDKMARIKYQPKSAEGTNVF